MKTGWERKPLGSVCTLQRGLDLPTPQRVKGIFPLVSSSGVIDTHIEGPIKGPGVITGRSGSVGKVFFVNEDFWPLNTTLYVRDFHGNEPRFVFHLLNHFDLQRFAGGAGVPTLNRNDVHGEPVFVPSDIQEQQRIVTILDEAFDAIAAARTNAEQNRQNARDLFESYLQSVFNQRGEGCVERRLGDQTLLRMIDGDRGTNYPKATDFLDHGPCLFLNTKNVRPNGFEFDSTMFISAEKDAQLRKGKLQRNDVVMTTRGTIGNIGLYSEEIPFDSVRINSGMLIFRANQTEILPAYLFEILRSGIVKEQINKYTTGAAQPQLPIKTLVNFSIPVPTTLAGQSELVKRIREFEPEIQRLESLYQRKLAALDELKQSLLQQAFSGQL
ncbi:restriction endonuclease subunit S [Aeromonas salmonicida]